MCVFAGAQYILLLSNGPDGREGEMRIIIASLGLTENTLD